jgi:hypothetical protein
MVESRTFYITRCDDDQLETGTPPQGYLRRQAKKSRVGKSTTSGLLTGEPVPSSFRRDIIAAAEIGRQTARSKDRLTGDKSC